MKLCSALVCMTLREKAHEDEFCCGLHDDSHSPRGTACTPPCRPGVWRELTLEFEPLQSVLVRVDADGSVHPIDIGFVPKTRDGSP